MNRNLQSPTKLTEFAPLQPEEKPQGVTQFISKFFKLNRFNNTQDNIQTQESNSDKILPESLPAWAVDNTTEDDQNLGESYPVEMGEGRSLPNVVKRISSLLALNKTSNSQAYSDSDLKQYWMPDSVSKECYECCEKFTTFKRRHHCRVCGQIFCAQCCSIQIPGKIFGYTGYLRACRYCCRIVIGYLESLDPGPELGAYLKQLQDSVEDKYNTNAEYSTNLVQNRLSPISSSSDSLDVGGNLRRKISVGYQEEKFAPGSSSGNYITIEERCKALQNSVSLRNLYDEICRPTTGIILRKQKYRLRNYTDCFLGSELVDWLIRQQKANTRIQACTFCQALLEGGYIESISEPSAFIDGFALYKLGVVISPEPVQIITETVSQDEPSWVKCIPQEPIGDSEADPLTPTFNRPPGRLTSSSSYTLDLNIGANTVYLSKPMPSNISISSSDDGELSDQRGSNGEISVVRTTEQREKAPESGWHNPTQLRQENSEELAYNLLQQAFMQHESSLVKQLLNQQSLQLSWSEILVTLVHEIVDTVRPDLNHNAEAIDIRHYVKFKKLCGGARQDCKLVRGIVCSKNVAHKGMANRYDNPKILLLEGAIVYQRIEGRLMSLEPVLMQEHESLRNLAAKILALKPDIVLVQRNVARLAQDILREQGVTLVINVKQKILESLARCMQADLIASLDAHLIGKPRLGTCKSFSLKSFQNNCGESKTLMFFEGLPHGHLGSTVLLRGASQKELIRVKKVASLLLFTHYNWRLEKSFLMDMFALPPNSKDEFFYDSKDNSPTEVTPAVEIMEENPLKLRKISRLSQSIFDGNENDTEVFNKTSENKTKSEIAACNLEDKKVISQVVKDFTDPLHSLTQIDEVLKDSSQKLSVAELPFSNHFRKALDDTILCVSPFVMFTVPYLETENGRKCKLRKFFPNQIFYSDQFSNTKRKTKIIEDDSKQNKQSKTKLKPPHPFVTIKLGTNVNSNDIQNLLAHYRACGGRYEKKTKFDFARRNSDEDMKEKQKENDEHPDVLDPYNHQKIDALYYSFSHKSANAPAFCVNPWVVHMTFYKDNDIPLGCFLEKYCFRMSYGCQSKTCGIAMMNHIRRFVHNSGCISISLDVLDNKISEDKIIMWSWCQNCQTCSPSVPMSSDTWSFSLAKYLELRFHSGPYTRRGNVPCSHSLHQDNLQYFSYNNIVATFEYTHIQLWEISLPPPIINIIYNKTKQHTDMIEEIKSMALKGHEIFSVVFEKLSALPSDFDGLANLKQMLTKEQSTFKQKVEEVQLKLTSPSLEKTDDNFANPNLEIQVAVWKISDVLIRIKRLVVEAVDQWNMRLSESIKKRDIDKKKDKLSQADQESPGTPDSRGSLANSEPEIKDIPSGSITKKIKSLDQGDDEYVTNRPLRINVDEVSIACAEVLDEQYSKNQNSAFVICSTPSKKVDAGVVKQFRQFKSYPPDNRTQCSKSFLVHLENYQKQDNAPSSPKAHHRSQSDGTMLSQYEDLHDGRKEDKKTVKHIFSQLLTSTTQFIPISNPFHSQEHYMLPIGIHFPVIVYENEPSSIIAYALNSFDYKRSLEELSFKSPHSNEQSPSPVHKRYTHNDKERVENNDTTEKSTGLLAFLRNKESKTDLLSSTSVSSDLSQSAEQLQCPDKSDDCKKSKNPHIEVQFEDSNCNFFCRIYFAEKFAHLRSFMLPIGEEAYVRSLSRSVQWNARGGKSGSTFCKTTDDRFILKEMSKSEFQLFLEFAPNYFAYMNRCHDTAQPTLLGKIIGIYQIIFKNNTTNASLRMYLLVMENLFYNRTVTQKFDLKGSMRNRLVNPDNQDGEIVLLDENLLKMSCDSPLYILPHSKTVLTAAIQKDIEFLSAQSVMDYSLLVGLDPENKELVVGIIDYIRTFTWDKKLETMVKKSGILWGQGKLPTIVSPDEYRDRFIEAMHKYFLEVPDPWTGLGKNLEY